MKEKEFKLDTLILEKLSECASRIISACNPQVAFAHAAVANYCSECTNNYQTKNTGPQNYCHDCTSCHATHSK